MPKRVRLYIGTWVTSLPENRIRPAVGDTDPAMAPNRVDLPAPFGPITPQISPRLTTIETSFSAVKPPNRFDTAFNSRIDCASTGMRAHLCASQQKVVEQSAQALRRKQRHQDHQDSDAKNRLPSRKTKK